MHSIDLSEKPELFCNKRIMILVPHQDDEINLTGNILKTLAAENDVVVVYLCAPENTTSAKIRQNEALCALSVFGICPDHVQFLCFPDTPNSHPNHHFTQNGGREKVVQAICRTIISIQPDIILGTDFDFHADHRVAAICLREAVNRLLKEKQVKPGLGVFFGFCYETSWHAKEDYRVFNLENTVSCSPVLSNCSYRWEDRISICSEADPHPRFIWNTTVFKALAKHKSQFGVLHAASVINRDNVFWAMRTDNKALFADIYASSGNTSRLNDSLILDTEDICTLDPLKIDFQKALWQPNTLTSSIEIRFHDLEWVSQIVLHGSPNDSHKLIVCGQIHINNNVLSIKQLEPYGQATIISIPPEPAKCIYLTFDMSDYDYPLALSEIEIFGLSKSTNALTETFPNIPLYVAHPLLETINSLGYRIIRTFVRLQRKAQNLLKRLCFTRIDSSTDL